MSTTDTAVFVDNAELFEYEDKVNAAAATPYDDSSTPCDALVINGISTVGYSTGLIEKIAGFSAINGSSGIITGITTSTGSGSIH